MPLGLTPDSVRPPSGEVLSLDGPTMGVAWSVRAVLPLGRDGRALGEAVQRRLNDIVLQMSQWEPGSDLSRFNAAPAGASITLPNDFWTVLSYAARLAADTEGAFDPTLGRLVDLWGFGPARAAGPPDHAAIRRALEDGGWRRLALEPATGSARQPGGLHLDLSGVAKGFGVDAAAAVLEAAGLDAYLVEIGGELRGAGVKPDSSPWWVEIETPPDLERSPEPIRLALHGLSVATSGDYRRARIENGRRVAHTLDPRTGRPLADPPASVTVAHPRCMAADALCTALTVMGIDHGLAYADRGGIAARFVARDGGERFSAAFAAMLD